MTDKPVLIVEDDSHIQDVLTLALEFEGYKVVRASNGQEALEVLAKIDHPGLILLDLMMPVMSGWEFAEVIKHDEKLKDIPILVVSAFSDKAKDIECSGFVQKPLELENLLANVHQYYH